MTIDEFSGFIKKIHDDIVLHDDTESFDVIHEIWKEYHDEKLLHEMDNVILKGKEPESFEISKHVHEINGVLMHFFIIRLIRRYSWAIPTNDAIQTIVKYSPVVEMGAGTGYWAKLVREAGGEIIPIDLHPPRTGHNTQTNEREWVEVIPGIPKDLSKYKDHALLLCWLPNGERMGEECLEHYRGKYLIYIGENSNGCNGTRRFHEMLRTDFRKVEEVDIPSWLGHHDHFIVYERVGYYPCLKGLFD